MEDVQEHEMPKQDRPPFRDDYPPLSPSAPATAPEWGTWEELLLAAAVDRHGTTDWDAVAVEVHGRTTSLLVPTPDNCRQRYHVLRGRFAAGDDAAGDAAAAAEIPWVEELRKLRVAELRREVRRCDVSIVSMQLKVKKLEEERERCLEEEKGEGRDGADPANCEGEVGTDGFDRKLAVAAAANDEADTAAGGDDEGNDLDGDESDRENRSFNESNSTDLKEENPEVRAAEGQQHPRPANSLQQLGQADHALKPGSRSGSSNTVAGESRSSPDPARAAETGESTEFRGLAGVKESSDVQSAASLSRRRRKRDFAGGASSGSGGDESLADKMACAKSQPLAGFLEIIRSHNFGSLFERRFEIQETKEYQLKIRQHVDLQMVSSKLQQGLYSHDHHLFFRDLLLICTNATVFFPPTSDEFAAAVGLRRIITREMGIAIRKSRSVAAPPPPLQPKSDPGDTVSSSPEKPTSSSKSKKTQAKVETEAVEMKEPDHLSENTVRKPLVFRKKRKERSSTGLRGARSGRGRGATTSIAAAAAKSAPPVTDKPQKNASSSSVAKKRSPASFLSRMKRNTPSGNLLDTLKASTDASPSGCSGGGAETKKVGSHSNRRASAGKQTAAAAGEQGSPITPKRSVGRPPKKVATRSSQGRGRREGVEAAAAKQQGRKRGRR